MRKSFMLAGTEIQAGERRQIDIPLPGLSAQTNMSMSVHVIHGKQDGPVLFVSSAIHGDELNGIEIVRLILNSKSVAKLKGTLIAVPVVNPYGLIQASRYLPDRRDLNRSFPGSDRGSLAARLANLFMEQIVSVSTHGIDLHTGSGHRSNLPQIRANLDDPITSELAHAFGVPVLINSSLRDGSLRGSASEIGVPTLLYEAGEALRYNHMCIRAGVSGVLKVMRALGMFAPRKPTTKTASEPFIARSSSWLRAPESGMFRSSTRLGAQVNRGDVLGHISQASDGKSDEVVATVRGVIIGRLELPVVHEGDALFHIARFKEDVDDVANQVESFQQDHRLG